jgi:hypothetical protein
MPTTFFLLLVSIWPQGHHLPLVRNQVKVTEEAHVWGPTYFAMMKLIYMDHNLCPEFTIWWLLQCPPLFCCFLFLFDPEDIICHWWGIESKWLKKHMYEYQLIFQWCSWYMSIIFHVLNSQFGSCCNAHHCFAVSCSYLTQKPSFATGEDRSQNNWRIPCKSTN